MEEQNLSQEDRDLQKKFFAVHSDKNAFLDKLRADIAVKEQKVALDKEKWIVDFRQVGEFCKRKVDEEMYPNDSRLDICARIRRRAGSAISQLFL